MAKKFLVSIDLVKNEIQNAVAQVLASAPGSPVPGQFYYNSTSGRLEYRGAAAWIDPTDRANHSGTQAWSTLTGTPTTLAGYGISDAQAGSAQLTSLASLATNGLVVRNASNSIVSRSLASGTTAATWTNADGVSGNPTLSIADVVAGGASGLMTGADKAKLNGIASGATANDTDANLRARSSHTGTQAASTISDFDTQVRTSRLDQMAAPTASVSLNSQKITNLAAPTLASDAATKQYVDDSIAGLSWKDEVRAATTANITLSGTQTVDGVALVANDRVLVKDQSTQSQNGIYIVAAGAWSRASDADTAAEILGLAVYVANGTTNGGARFVNSNTGTINLGTTNITFATFGGGGTYSAGNGLNLTGNTFSVVAGTGISVGANVSIDTSVVSRKYAATIGNGASTSIAVTHGLGTLDVVVQIYEVATGATVECDVTRNSTTQVTLGFSVAPASNALRVVVQG